ncbi:oligosaccharide flippase family protein [bacterium]|mgnify:CR=1 FL=1|nr:oligosaccharide flippase family protein [bacterium]
MIIKIKALLKQDLISNIIHTYSSRILLIILGLMSNIMITRYLGVENYGIYSLSLIIIALGTQFGNFGLHAANIYYVAKKKMLLGMLLKNSIVFSIVSGITISLIIYFISLFYPNIINLDISILLIIMIMIPISLMSLFTKNLLIGIGKIKLDNKISIYTRILTILLLLLSISLFTLDIKVALSIFAIGIIVSLVFILRTLKKDVTYRYKLSSKLMKNISGFGMKAYMSALFAFLVLKSDLFFVNYYLSKSELGYYSLAVSFIDYIYMLPVIIGTILFQKLSSMKNNKQKYETMKKLSFYFTIIYAIFLLGIYLTSDFLITTLYGNDFSKSVISINILLIAIFFMGMQTIQVQYLNTIGYPKAILYYWMIALCINILINILFIEQYGLLSVALSTVIAYFLMYIFIRIHIYRKVIISNEHKIHNK